MPTGTPNYELQLVGDQYVTDTSWTSTEGFAVYPPKSSGTGDRLGYVYWSDVISIDWRYGRRHNERETRGGAMRIVLKNSDWKFTPEAGGTFSEAKWLKTPVCIQIAGNVTADNSYPQILFNGEVIDYEFDFPTDIVQSTMTLIIGDRISVLGNQVLTGAIWSVDASSQEALNAIVTTAACGQNGCDLAGSVGETDLQAYTASDSVGNRAGDIITRISNTEQGDVTVRNGSMYSNTMGNRIMMIARYGGDAASLFGASVTDHGIATFDDNDANYDNFESLQLTADADFIVNRASYTMVGGAEQVYSDSDSIDEYRVQGLSRSNLFYKTNGAALDAATRIVEFQKEVNLNVSSVKGKKRAVGPPSNANRLGVFDTNTNGLLTSCGSGVTVKITKPASATQITFGKQCVNKRWMQIEYDLADLPLAAFTLDDPSLGVLDDDRLG